MTKNKEFYIGEILRSIRIIENYIKWKEFNDFSDEIQLFDACCMRLQHIWECWIKLWEMMKDQNNWIPFEKMRGFRNRITHDYAWIDDLLVWNTIKENLPQLKKQLKNLK